MTTKQVDETMMDALISEWTAKIKFLIATAAKADTAQRIKYFEYIDSLQARQQNLQDVLQALHSSSDLAYKEFGESNIPGKI